MRRSRVEVGIQSALLAFLHGSFSWTEHLVTVVIDLYFNWVESTCRGRRRPVARRAHRKWALTQCWHWASAVMMILLVVCSVSVLVSAWRLGRRHWLLITIATTAVGCMAWQRAWHTGVCEDIFQCVTFDSCYDGDTCTVHLPK